MIPLATLVSLCLTWYVPVYTLYPQNLVVHGYAGCMSGESGSPRLWVEGTHWMRYLTDEPRPSIHLLWHIWQSIWASSWPQLSLWLAALQDAATSYGHLKTTRRFWVSFWMKKKNLFCSLHLPWYTFLTPSPSSSSQQWDNMALMWNVGHVIWIGWEMHWSIFFANCLWEWDAYWIPWVRQWAVLQLLLYGITSIGIISSFVTITLTNTN
jgi:hypothetical protein